MAEPVVAVRVYMKADQSLYFPPDQVSYGQDKDGMWWFRHPKDGAGLLVNHFVIEHSDHTITVTPSIQGPNSHGCLTNGVWTDY